MLWIKKLIRGFGTHKMDRMGSKKIFGVHSEKANMLSCMNI